MSRTALACIVVMLAAGLGSCGRGGPARGHTDTGPDSLKILEMLLLDGELKDIEVANSAIRIDSAGLRSVVALGDPALGPLVRIAKREDMSFHTFCLAVNAAERILQKHDATYRLPWYGGVSMYKEQASRVRRLKPGGQMDEAEFRSQIVHSIEEKSKELGLLE